MPCVLTPVLYWRACRLDDFSRNTIFSGVYPVFDPTTAYSVSVSKTCTGSILSDDAYVLWYRATDIYGNKTAAIPARVAFV